MLVRGGRKSGREKEGGGDCLMLARGGRRSSDAGKRREGEGGGDCLMLARGGRRLSARGGGRELEEGERGGRRLFHADKICLYSLT